MKGAKCMNRCSNCKYEYRYEDMFTASWKLKTPAPAPCPKCGKMHYISSHRIMKIYMSAIVINLLIMLCVNLFHIHSLVLLTLYILSLILFVIYIPILNKVTEFPESFNKARLHSINEQERQ